jgi:hypothetical protein
MLRFHPVASTSIDTVAYDDETGVLYLRFRDSKALYAYDGVPERIVEELLAADSKGIYVNEEIKPAYSGRRVRRLPGTKAS